MGIGAGVFGASRMGRNLLGMGKMQGLAHGKAFAVRMEGSTSLLVYPVSWGI